MFTKNFLITSLMFVFVSSVSAQYNTPTITLNSVLNYAISVPTGDVRMTLKIVDADDESIKLDWSINELGKGSFIMKTEALREGSHFFWGQPEAGTDTRLDENETVASFSTQFYNELMQNGKATYDAVVFLKKNAPADKVYKLEGKDVDKLYAESEDGKVKVWLLKDANAPIILKMEGNAAGMDILLESVE